MADPPASSDKRRFPRLKDSCRIRFRRVESGAIPVEGNEALTVNISGGGICFESGEPVEPGSLVAIELTLPEFESAVVSLGRAVWCEELGEGRFQVGMEFWWIGWGDDGAQKAISGYIKDALEA
jgi:hypothetical protein